MDIAEQEKQIFNEWQKNRSRFVTDGVVDEKEYLASSLRLLFVLKEVNSNDKCWDLREYLRKKNEKHQTWDNITRWVDGIRNLDMEIPWEKLKKPFSPEKRMETLRSICVINLKKSPGGHTTDNKELEGAAKEDSKFLNRQFSIYAPDIVICCGSIVSYFFHKLIEIPGETRWKTTQRGVEFHELQPNCYLISYSHPEARVPNNLLYYGLIDAVREICPKKPMDKTPGA